MPSRSRPKTAAKQAKFQDAMRKLWEDHITWTRLAIISFAHDLPDLPRRRPGCCATRRTSETRSSRTTGSAAGDQLKALLKEHIIGAVALLKAAKVVDQALIEQRTDEWYANGNEISDFLHQANPRNWSQKAMRRMMKAHLDDTLSEAVHRLTGKYAADIRDYDHPPHILMMADTLSNGIIKQFPRKFR